jgi:hypothetical protein
MSWDDMDTKPILIFRREDRIEYVLSGLCRYWNVSREELVSKRARTDNRYKMKRITIKILRDIADCSFKDIRFVFAHGDEANTWQIHNRVSEDLESGFSTNKELKAEYKDILNYLGL